MSDWILNLAGSWLGLKTLWDKVDGYKTYMSGAAQMLTGFSGILGSVASEADAFVANVHSIADAYRFGLNLYQHPDAPALFAIGAWGLVLTGWHTIAKKHAEDKALAAANAVKTVIAAPAAPTPATVIPAIPVAATPPAAA